MSSRASTIIVALALSGLAFSLPTASATEIGAGTIGVDHTLTLAGSPYIVRGNLEVAGTDGADGVTTLTIEPGVVVRFDPFARLTIGGAGPGALVALGTPGSPILLGAEGASAWDGIEIVGGPGDAITSLENVTIDRAGASDAALSFHGSIARIGAVSITRSVSNGVRVSGGAPVLEGTRIEESALHGIVGIAGAPQLRDVLLADNGGRPMSVAGTGIFVDVRVAGNAEPLPELGVATHATDSRWGVVRDDVSGATVPYLVTGRQHVQGVDADGIATLTIDPGVSLRLDPTIGLDIGSASLPGALHARGTADDRITFDASATPGTAGSWGTVYVEGTASGGARSTRIENVTFRDGGGPVGHTVTLFQAEPTFRNNLVQNGGPGGCIRLHGAAPVVESSRFLQCQGYAILVGAGRPTLRDVRIEETTSSPIRMLPSTILDNVTVRDTASTIDVEAQEGLAVDNAWPRVAGPLAALVYRIIGTDLVVAGIDGVDGVATLTLQDGAFVQMPRGSSLAIGDGTTPGGLIARGSTGLYASPPNAGEWQGIVARGAPGPASATFIDVRGMTIEAAVRPIDATDARVTLEDVATIRASEGSVLRGGAPILVRNTSFTGDSVALRGIALSDTQIVSSRITSIQRGLVLEDSAGVVLESNAIAAGLAAARFMNVDGARLERNTFESYRDPVSFDASSSGDLIVDNTFFMGASGPSVWDDGASNTWSQAPRAGPNIVGGALRGGNAYAEYAGADLTVPPDGLGETPFTIAGSAGSVDAHPLTGYVPPDRVAPVSEIVLDGLLGPAGWYRSDVTVTLSATDDRGPASLHYRVGAGALGPYTTPVRVVDEGTSAFRWQAVDASGNREALRETLVRIDRSAPTVSVERQEPYRDLCLVARALDTGAGVASLRVTVRDADGAVARDGAGRLLQDVAMADGAPWCAGLVAEADFSTTVSAIDGAGNVGLAPPSTYPVDTIAPRIVFERPEHGRVYVDDAELAGASAPADRAVVLDSVTVRAHAIDRWGSLVILWIDDLEIGGGARVEQEVGGSGMEPGEHQLRIVATDGVGHRTEETRTILFVSTTPPLPAPLR